MKLFRFDKTIGAKITRYVSRSLYVTHLAQLDGSTQISYLVLDAHGRVGRHKTETDQLFCVVHGQGWVSGAAGSRMPIQGGQAAYWTSGEWHEVGTVEGLTAVVIEAETLDPEKLLKRV